MRLTIVLRKEVEDAEEGAFLFALVKDRLSDHPDVEVKGTVANHFPDEEPI